MPYTFDAYEAYERARDFLVPRCRRGVEYIKRKFQERRAKQKKENPQDNAARSTARATWIIALFTIVTAGIGVMTYLAINGQLEAMRGQLKEMRDASVDSKKLIDANVSLAAAAQKSAATADQNLIATQRAWVGTIDAAFIKTPNGTVVKGTVSYINSGKEPARISTSAQEYLYSREEWNSFGPTNAVVQRQQACLSIPSIAGSQFAWPTTGFSVYFIHFPKGQIPQKGVVGWTDRISNGDDILLVDGCITYEAFSKIHHTAFCYFFDSKISDLSHLSICGFGNAVD